MDGLTVLLVDDKENSRDAMKDAMAAFDIEVAGEAANGAQALTAYEELRPTVVLMDLVLPDVDGISVIRSIREMDERACVIVCSGLYRSEKQQEALEAGACRFFVKPFDVIELCDYIKTRYAEFRGKVE